jgi:polyvinyl alcohol dehydrogenase (cytochrome)
MKSTLRFRVVSSAVVVAGLLGFATYHHARATAFNAGGEWPFWGGDLHNTHNAAGETRISPATARQLRPSWSFTTLGNITSVPTVKDGRVYVMDGGVPLLELASKLRVFDAQSGHQLWEHAISDYSKSLVNSVARTSPVVEGKLVLFGDNRTQPSSLLGFSGEGASLYAVDKESGELVWKTKVDDHPFAVITQSPTVYKGVIYVGTSSLEEAAARLGYDCCTFRASMLAVDAKSGAILWKRYMVPENGGRTDGFSGAAVWGSSPSIDEARGVVYIATGNNYNFPDALQACLAQHRGDAEAQQKDCYALLDAKNNYADSVLALDLQTGAVRWAQKLRNFGAWTFACEPNLVPLIPRNLKNCRDVESADFDFGQAPMLYTAKTASGPRQLLAAGQKSGLMWAFDPDRDGAVVWTTRVGPGGVLGGNEWGSATDGERIYTAITNFEHNPVKLVAGPHAGETVRGGYWSALDAATGEILWQTPDPSSARPLKGLQVHAVWGAFLGDGFFAATLGPLTVANGVVFAGSMDREGHMYGFDARDGAIVWSFASGGSVQSAPSVVDGTVYWGSGSEKGFNNNRFYAFRLPTP